jgi:hypothetical protein
MGGEHDVSLDAAERKRTSEELQANCRLSELSLEDVQAGTGFSPEQLETTIAVAQRANPADVWQLRDFLDSAVRRHGIEPMPYSYLTEEIRASAELWFPPSAGARHRS